MSQVRAPALLAGKWFRSRDAIERFSATELAVGKELAYHLGQDGTAWPGVGTLAEQTRLSPGTVSRALKALCCGTRAPFEQRRRRRSSSLYRFRFLDMREAQVLPVQDMREAQDKDRKTGQSRPAPDAVKICASRQRIKEEQTREQTKNPLPPVENSADEPRASGTDDPDEDLDQERLMALSHAQRKAAKRATRTRRTCYSPRGKLLADLVIQGHAKGLDPSRAEVAAAIELFDRYGKVRRGWREYLAARRA